MSAAFVVRFWIRRLSQRYTDQQLLTCSLAVTGVTYFLFPFFETPLALDAIAFLLGLGLGCGQPLSLALTYNCAPSGRAGGALGLRLAVNRFTQIAGGYLAVRRVKYCGAWRAVARYVSFANP